jgi:hypothetical protein
MISSWRGGIELYKDTVDPLFFGGASAIGVGTGTNQATGVSNGSAALAAAADKALTEDKILVISGSRYNIGSTFQIPKGIRVVFQAVLWGLSVTGPLIKVGTGGDTPTNSQPTIVNYARVGGIASQEAVLIDNAQGVYWDGLAPVAGARFLRMARFRWTWDSEYRNFKSYANDAENGTDPANRTISGDCFVFGRNVNNAVFSGFYTSNYGSSVAGATYLKNTNFLIDADFGESSVIGQNQTQGLHLQGFTAQGGCQGLWVRRATGVIVTGWYSEAVARPFVFGDDADASGQKVAEFCKVSGGYCGAVLPSHPFFFEAKVAVDLDFCQSITIDTIDFSASCFGALDWASVTVSGGGVGATGAKAVAVVNRSGQIIGAYWVSVGVNYTTAPTLTVSSPTVDGRAGTGSGAALTATGPPGPTSSITITSAGSGYGASQPYFPAAVRYKKVWNCTVDLIARTQPQTGIPRADVTWPLIVRKSSSPFSAGISGKVYSLWGLPSPANDGNVADLVKAQSDGQVGHLHYLISYRGDGTGTLESRRFVPCVMA